MNKWMKRLTIGVVLMSLQTVTFADTLTPLSITDTAKTSNSSMKLLNLQLEREEEEYKKAKALAVGVAANKDDDEGMPYSDVVVRDYKPLTAEKSFLDKKYEYIKAENSNELQAIEKYYNLLNLEKDKTTKKDDYDFMSTKYSSKQKEYELGQITEVELQKFELSLNETFVAYMKSNSSYESAKRALNIFMGMDVENAVVLSDADFPKPTSNTIDLEVMSQTLVENSYRIDQIEKDIVIKQTDMRLKSRFKGYGDKKIEINLLEDQIFSLTEKLESEARQIKADLYDKYYDMEIALENQKIKDLEYQIAQKNFVVAELKYENGLLSSLDYLQAKQELKTSEFNYNSAIITYYVEVEQFNDFINENSVIVDVN